MTKFIYIIRPKEARFFGFNFTCFYISKETETGASDDYDELKSPGCLLS